MKKWGKGEMKKWGNEEMGERGRMKNGKLKTLLSDYNSIKQV